MVFDLHLAYFETSGLMEKQKFALGLKNGGLLSVKWETPSRWLSQRSGKVA